MQAEKSWYALTANLHYLLFGCSFILGILIKDPLLSSWSSIWDTTTPLITINNTHAPENNDLLITEGDEQFKNNNFDEAITKYKKAIGQDLFIAMTFMRLAATSCHLDKYEQAEHFYKTAIIFHPGILTAYIKLGIIQHKLQKYDAALRTFTAVSLLQPDHFDAIFNISKIYYDLHQLDKAIEYAKKAIELQPDNVHTYLSLGHIYNKKGDTHAACTQYEQAVQLEPELANAHYNLGYTLRIQGEPKKALPYLHKSLELQTDYPEAHIALAESYWSLGDFKKAWQHYEHRWEQFGIDPKKLETPLWDGTPLHGKTIFLYSEQGMGDTLQFLRYAKKIKEEYNGRIICKVQKPIAQLVKLCPYIDQVIVDANHNEAEPAAQAPLLNLPGILNTTVETIPNDIPYLYADKNLVELWRKKLSLDKNIKIGICWHVLPQHESGKSPLALRSIPLASLAPLADIPGVSFYSLQKIDGMTELLSLPEKFVVKHFGNDFDESHGRFMDTAALIANLDLIISVDTSIIHLAGGMGKPVWTLLPYSSDCRWDIYKNTTPWYKTMHLFRQSLPQSWTSVVKELMKALQLFIKTDKN